VPEKPDKKDELRLLINSRHPLITIETAEEERVQQVLREVAAELGIGFYTWSVTSGLALAGGSPMYNTQNPERALANIGMLDGDGILPAEGFHFDIANKIAFAGSDADAGLSQRLLATMLTWMPDRESGVFLAATSNNISSLPPEMLRKGRFDEIFFVDLPNADVRAALFALHLKKRGRDAAGFDLKKLAATSEGFSGAEIEQAIVSALYTAFAQKHALSTEILLGELCGTEPLSVTRAEEVLALRGWAKTRAVPAD
jgi:hypothetical protein